MEEHRPDPDLLLQKLAPKQGGSRGRGRLKIFFGYAAGVGKTYAMLDAAHTAQKAGMEVVVGYVEPHTRPETLALLPGLEQLPPLAVPYKGITLREFDLDAALHRHPQLVLVDELAHTNAPGCRHTKRYSDVEELLRAGIDVYTTVNVQHLESLNDIVASITQVVVRERIPDYVFDSADQVELVDIEPDDLIDRLHQGKIYRTGQAERALDHFFTRENLVALREIALRRTADRVNRPAAAKQTGREGGYFTGEHILICLSSSPSNAKVIRTAARMASAFHARFTALFVETPQTKSLSPEDQQRLQANVKLAEEMGAQITTIWGENVPYQIAEYAKASGVSKLVVGRSNNRASLFHPHANLVGQLTELAPNLDIYIIPDANLGNRYRQPHPAPPKKLGERDWGRDWALLLGILVLCTLAGLAFDRWGLRDANVITIYILGVLLVSTLTRGKTYGIVASVLSVLAFNFCFTHPRWTFQAYDAGYPITFGVMLAAALITSTLTNRAHHQTQAAAGQAFRTQILLETSQKLQRTVNREQVYQQVAVQTRQLLDRPVILYPVQEGQLGTAQVYGLREGEAMPAVYTGPEEAAVAAWVVRNREAAGISTQTLPGAQALYLPMISGGQVLAVLGVVLAPEEELPPFERSLLATMLTETASVLEKYTLSEAQKRSAWQAERDRLRANLLRAISHDLRTPLTSISGNANLLLESGSQLPAAARRQLCEDIYDDSLWLINLVENLLSITRIDSGGVLEIHTQAELIEEVITEALAHTNRKRSEHEISVKMEDHLLLARMDSRLIVQVIINIVNNAIQYSAAGSHIQLTAWAQEEQVVVEVADDGPGIPDEDKGRLFELYFTQPNGGGDSRRGFGLGLSLCKSIVEAHGGRIYVRDHPPHGTVLGFTLPREEVKPDGQNLSD